jgi:hypothetical protein
MAMVYGEISSIGPGDICVICGYMAAVKVLFVEEREVLFCDLHAFVNSEIIWENALAIYDRSDILPPRPSLP